MTHAPPHDGSNPLQLAVRLVASGDRLSMQQARSAFAHMIDGTASPALMAALLVGLRARGETAAEVAGAALALRDAMVPVAHPEPHRLVDTCGTGGGISTVNISTAAAFVVAAAGIPVAKHGNRSFTSRSGSADVLEALGVAIDLTPSMAATTLRETGMAFLFAPTYHPAMRHVAVVRRELGVPTLMNLIGPLANPASASRQVIGVADRQRAEVIADALTLLGTRHAWVVNAAVGLDEIAPQGITTVWEIRDGRVVIHEIDPNHYGHAATLTGLEGGEPADNAVRIVELFRKPGGAPSALRSAVLLNAAAAIYVSGEVESFEAAIATATDALMSGAAMRQLERLQNRAAAGNVVR